jgi:hypothetical protein
VALDEQLAARPDHPEWAPGHPQLTVRGTGRSFDLELAVELADLRFQLERDGAAADGQPTAHFERVVVQID